jgi:cytochrome c556
MNITFSFSRYLLVALSVAVAGALALPVLAETPTEIVMKREKAMKEMGGHMKAISGFIKQGEGTAEDVARRAGEIGVTAANITALFPEGTEMNGAEKSKFKAKPEIWLDWENFEKSAAALGAESKALAAAANGGDKESIAAAFKSLADKGCTSCHKAYRMKVN